MAEDHPRKLPVEAVNFHLWQPCNMRCRFCFAGFRDVRATVLPDGHLTRREAILVVALLAESGFQKITFAGGEPLLCPWLPELVRVARIRGMTTAMVTNGSLLNGELLARLSGNLDWLAISIDSIDVQTMRTVGRTSAGRAITPARYVELCRGVVTAGIRLKVNTVVTRANWQEDLSELILTVRPRRWKIMQVLPIGGQNSGRVDALLVTATQFEAFVERHRHVQGHGVTLLPEANNDMVGSYAMIDPAGRFYDNVDGTYTYSDPILLRGVHEAIAQVRISREKFLARGGRYDWAASPRLEAMTS